MVFSLDIYPYRLYSDPKPFMLRKKRLEMAFNWKGQPMNEKGAKMDRRSFLWKLGSFLVGGSLGLNSFSKAFAFSYLAPKPSVKPYVALIIDDIGFSRFRARQFLELEIPMTFAILPRLEKSYDLAFEIDSKGHEIMLHQPMEPYDPNIDPGPGALFVGDEPDRIINTMEENIASLPFAIGVNNHMGSRFTSRQREMNEVLGIIKGKHLFFVDSVTTSRSTAYGTAKRLHMAAAFRDIFLDNVPEEPHILSQLYKLRRHALRHGRAIGIGHPFPETAKAIGRFFSDPAQSSVSLVHVSRVLDT